jgi:hypothetical protein
MCKAARLSLSRFRGGGGPRGEAVGGEGLYSRLGKILTSQAFGLGAAAPVKSGRGVRGCDPVAALNPKENARGLSPARIPLRILPLVTGGSR